MIGPRALAACAAWLAFTLASFPLAGCMAADTGAKADTTNIDPFPKPLGESLIPLAKEFYAAYRYAEFDSDGHAILRENLSLHVFPKLPGTYAYAFENGNSGYLLEQRDGGGNRDSAGVYIVGSFRDSVTRLDSTPALWLPQFPRLGSAWYLSPTRRTEVVSTDTVFWTEALRGIGVDSAAYVRAGMQRQPSVLFKETAGDTVTYYHFRRGVGCVGFQRAARGKLIAAGSLYEFYAYRNGGYIPD